MSTAVALLKVCAWCDREKTTGRIVPDDEQRQASHGICVECAGRILAKWIAKRAG